MLIKRRLAVTGLQILIFAVFFGIWQYIYSARIVPHTLLSSPLEVFSHFTSIVQTSLVSSHLIFTVELVLLSFVCTVAAGAALGMFIGEIRYLRKVLEPYAILTNSLPRVMFIPLFWTFFGLGIQYQFFFAFVSGVFPVLLTTMYAVGGIDPNLVRLARSMGANPFQVQFKLMLPNVIPAILSASRLSLNLTIGGVLIAEEFAGTSGIGYLASYFSNTIQPISLYVVVVAVAFISLALNIAMLMVEKYLTRWNAPRA